MSKSDPFLLLSLSIFFLKKKNRIIIMSKFTKVLHRKNYAAIDAASPEQSQAGRNILITGGSDVIGRAAAQGFVTAGADVVAITSRSKEKASRVAKEIEAVGKGTKVLGYQYEIGDEASVNALWDSLKRDGIEINVLILNTSANIPTAQERPYNPFRASEASSD
jgi:FlaA1/EpsC-like NDP-sugar epimerase